MRAEAEAHHFATQDALIAHVLELARRTGLPCPHDIVERLTNVLAMAAAEQHRRERQREECLRRALGPGWRSSIWRIRCAERGHRGECNTPTQCELRAAREGR